MKRLIKIDKNPNISVDKNIKLLLDPDYIYLNTNSNYKVNDYIYMGTKIDNHLVSISGRVINNDGKVLTIENDFRELSEEKNVKKKIKTRNDLEDILEKIKDYKTIDGIVVSAINDEPYIYNRIFLLKENIDKLLDTINLISKILNVNNNMICVKNNESFIIDECLNVIGTYPNIKIALLSDEYLIGHKEYLLNKLNMSNNTLFLTVEEVYNLYSEINGYLKTTKLITLLCNNEVTIVRVKLGTSLKSVIARYLKVKGKKHNITINGLMAGYEVDNTNNIYVTNDFESITISSLRKNKSLECINCGLCEEVCPEGVVIHSGKNIDKCLHCGLCSYICPARINLENFLGDHHE